MEEATPTQETYNSTKHVYPNVDVTLNEDTTPMEVDTVEPKNIIPKEILFRFLCHAIESEKVRSVTKQVPTDGTASPFSKRSIHDTMGQLGMQYLRDNQSRISQICTVCEGRATKIGRFVLASWPFNLGNRRVAEGEQPY